MASVVLLWGMAGCNQRPAAPAAKPAAPAAVAKLPTEADLVAVTLKPEAEVRLGIATAPVARRAAPRAITMGADVVPPPGHASIVAAPQTGTLAAAEAGTAPLPGLRVHKGQAVFTLLPILSADRAVPTPIERINFEAAKADADGQRKTAQARFDNAKAQLERTEQLTRSRDAPATALVDVRNTYDQAKAALDAAEERWRVFARTMGTEADEVGKLAPLPLRAPADGVLINVPVQVGQQVPAGSVLFEVAALDPVYVRVPVFVGEESVIAADREASVGGLADGPGQPTRPAKPVRTTPSANALSGTVDLYYEVANHDGRLRPNQRVGITLPLQGEAESLVVPHASIVRDINGGAWVYESLGKHVFARRRVIVAHVIGPDAILALGPKPGTPVVTDGAAELFGTEFGGGK